MRIHPYLRTLTTVLGFAAVTATAALGVMAPRTTYADDADDIGTVEGTRINDVVANAVVRRDASVKSGWVLVIDASNTSAQIEKCVVKTALERAFITPMSRVSNEVTTLLTRVESFDVPAHGKARVVREVPAWIAEQLVTSERIIKARAAELKRAEKDPNAYSSPIMAASYPEFRVALLEPNAPVAHFRREGGMMMAPPPPPIPAPSSSAVAAGANGPNGPNVRNVNARTNTSADLAAVF